MTIPSVRVLAMMIGNLDWNGHVELPDIDQAWLARELHAKLTGRSDVCDICHGSSAPSVRTPAGTLCAECIEDLHQEFYQ
jgi:hypothetical protein